MAAFVVRRLIVVATLVFIRSWPAQVSVLLGVPLVWTLVREYFRPFKVPTYRWCVGMRPASPHPPAAEQLVGCRAACASASCHKPSAMVVRSCRAGAAVVAMPGTTARSPVWTRW